MSLVLVLSTAPGAPCLTDDIAETLRARFDGEAPRWLMPGIACDIALPPTPGDRKVLAEQAREALSGAPIDANLVPARGRRKRLLVADMDSTIIGQECIDELADVLGLKPQVAAITERAMRGEIDFAPALRERVALLKGLDVADLKRVYDERIIPTPGAEALVATMRAHGATSLLVSGGFTFFTERVAARLGFDHHQANELLSAGTALTGTVADPILGRDAKRAALLEYVDRLGISADDVLAVGDGANDLAMLEAAGVGVAYRAKPAVAAEADARIEHGDLTALLFLQGYAAGDVAN